MKGAADLLSQAISAFAQVVHATPEEKLSALALVCLVGDAVSAIEIEVCAGRTWLKEPEKCPAFGRAQKFTKGYRNAKRERLCNSCGQAWHKIKRQKN